MQQVTEKHTFVQELKGVLKHAILQWKFPPNPKTLPMLYFKFGR